MTGIFYQAEGLREIGHIDVEPGTTVRKFKELLADILKLDGEILVFVEDEDTPLGIETVITEIKSPHGLKLHLHRCHDIEVSVTFNRKTVQHTFKPGTTVAKVKKWAAIKQFHMTPDEAGEHLLQISGTHDRPAPNTHLGTLVTQPHCQVKFDLVPDERVNGAPDGAA
ncbi:hypothetical protein EOA27_01785 [Mesorhizobium sp. M2A.F.Ca.ET.037.01.1.1]|uniref:hypothetical protein n=1 Tax=unclassified Mesorhizobium TaxID=325217 RepID=UPI000FCC8284|nr:MULTISPECIES: hypothetical protein [unclassified Mesorhizobium]RUX23022.1 hypothetical protein EOA27_01785 [Mesorhizobium sp. M2A.F.Ca.ET.037.01.1.1]RUY12167.1 hypothetical protein EOA25_04085 [Mesorhizobium sp. M2A.F.Ca.ET.040.01.1.1]RWA91616.1 MAG: hypothetical protein EOQ31_10905 [Mesorhizobium sp.]TIV14630.1 MAG: hypothetical protein E5V95_29595 [Mesorhizobium sp.]